jgi:hypothetical protein
MGGVLCVTSIECTTAIILLPRKSLYLGREKARGHSGLNTPAKKPGGTSLVSNFLAFASGLLIPYLVRQSLMNTSEHSAVQKTH